MRHSLATALIRLRQGKMLPDHAKALFAGYKTLADLLIDERDNRYKKRLRVLWEAHQKAQGLPVDAEPLGLPEGDVQ